MLEFLRFVRSTKLSLRRLLPASFGGVKRNIYNEFIQGKWMIYDYIRQKRCRRIMEVGVADGENARRMIEVAKENFKPTEIEYFGFDLFDEPPSKDEFLGNSGGFHMDKIKMKLNQIGGIIKLYKGDTRKVLPRVTKDLPLMDLIFIDGGHSYRTVKNDWEYARHLMHDKTGLFFDDCNLKGPRKVVDGIPREEFSVKLSGFSFTPRKMALVRKLSNP